MIFSVNMNIEGCRIPFYGSGHSHSADSLFFARAQQQRHGTAQQIETASTCTADAVRRDQKNGRVRRAVRKLETCRRLERDGSVRLTLQSILPEDDGR